MMKAYERQHRIEFLKRTWRENEKNNILESTEKVLAQVWASATPLLSRGKFQGNYLFAMHKINSSNARHAIANALRWNHKVFTITNRCEYSDRYEVWAREGEICQTTAS